MTPIKVLRSFFEQQKGLRPFSTQSGLAQLVGRSEGMIRAVESGRVPMSMKLAKLLSAKTGASTDWLMTASVTDSEIPSIDGSPLRYETAISRIKSEIERNLQQADRDLAMASRIDAEASAATGNPAVPMTRRMAAAMAKLVEDALFESLSRGESGMMDEITKILAKEQPTGT